MSFIVGEFQPTKEDQSAASHWALLPLYRRRLTGTNDVVKDELPSMSARCAKYCTCLEKAPGPRCRR